MDDYDELLVHVQRLQGQNDRLAAALREYVEAHGLLLALKEQLEEENMTLKARVAELESVKGFSETMQAAKTDGASAERAACAACGCMRCGELIRRAPRHAGGSDE